MKQRPKSVVPEENPLAPTAILRVKVWLTGISPMVWRCILVPSSFTLRELHGMIQESAERVDLGFAMGSRLRVAAVYPVFGICQSQ
jgi:hypothetical protein